MTNPDAKEMIFAWLAIFGVPFAFSLLLNGLVALFAWAGSV